MTREPEDAGRQEALRQQWADLHTWQPHSFAPLGSMVLVYCRECASQRLCDERGCIKRVRAAKRATE